MPRTAFIFVVFLFLTLPALAAKQEIEIIQLHHRDSSEIIPMIKPFLDPDATVTGFGYKLIVKSSRENLEAVKEIVHEVDGKMRRLMISVRQQEDRSRVERGAALDADVTLGEHGQVTAQSGQTDGDGVNVESGGVSARVYATDSRDTQPSVQKVQTLEGQWALIRVGQSVPVGQRTVSPSGVVSDTVTYKDVTTGFEVLARIADKQVTLHLRPHKQSLSAQGGGVIDTQEIQTSVSGALGEWIAVGGTLDQSSTTEHGLTYSTTSRLSTVGQVYVKVDILGH